LPTGTVIEAYRVEAVLGQGSFGITYLVEDVRLGLKFALKEYLPQDTAVRVSGGGVAPASAAERDSFARGMRRFLGEGQTLAGLDHPHIVKVIRYFEANGTAYLLMTYYEGQPLHALLATGGVFDNDEIRALTVPLLDALEYLHRNGVTHGDIKPANVYVTRQGDPILLDFGAARVANAKGEDRIAFGSEGYAALEQLQEGGELGPWTDIYGLAATLYRLIVGETPASAAQRWRSLSAGGADPLRALDKRLVINFDSGFLNAVWLGLQVPVEERPRSVVAWRRSFEQSLDVGPVPRGSRSPVARGEREWLPRILAGVVLLVLAGLLIYLFIGDRPVPTDNTDPVATSPADPAPVPSLAADDPSWAQAVKADTAAAYRDYLEAFPNGRHAADALAQLTFLDTERWSQVEVTATQEAFADYLEDFPEGQYRIEAEARLDALRLAEQADEAAWNRARNANTKAALDEYIAAFPNGAHLVDARFLRDLIEHRARDEEAWQAAQKIHRSAAYQSYLDAFPQGRHVAEALAALDDLTLRPGRVFRDCSDCPEMVVIPPGSFQQGSPRDADGARSSEQPQRLVRLAEPFAISLHELTFEAWDACVLAGGCRSQPVDNGWGRGAHPVMMVSFDDAQQYVTWLSSKTSQIYEIPSESQWEYVARAGEASAWAGGRSDAVCAFGNIAGSETPFEWRHDPCGDAFSVGTAAVGTFRANPMGVYDMIGNVAEWTRDCMNLSYLDAPSDGSAWERGMCNSRITRGGSWFSGTAEIRLPARFNLKAGERNDFTGIRLVRKIVE
jgi:formylglycine-generating enzyme required for sulfatase activity/serine/threonine protein kinase